MNFYELCRSTTCDTPAFSRLIFLWLTDASDMGSTWIAETIEFYKLTPEAIATLTEIQGVYNGKPSPASKLKYALIVERLIRIMSPRDNYFSGRTFPISDVLVNTALEI